ncbi:MAG: OprO/OprP family phosphate-selective porin [bacterium]
MSTLCSGENTPVFSAFVAFVLITLVTTPLIAQENLKDRINRLENRIDKLEKGEESSNFNLDFGGRVQNDWAFISEDDQIKSNNNIGNQPNGVEFRRSRLYVTGAYNDIVDFKVQYDFAGGSGNADFKDLYMNLSNLPGNTNLRIGHFWEPFGLENRISSKYITFMEYSLTNNFFPGRNNGLMVQKFSDGWGVEAGVFRPSDSFGNNQGDGVVSASARVFAQPIYLKNGRRVLHLGASYHHENPGGTVASFGADPEVHQASSFVSANVNNVTAQNSWSAEALWIDGPFSLQGEYVSNAVDRDNNPNPEFSAYYGSVSYVLTGERRPYKKSGSVGRLKPKQPVTRNAGGNINWRWGAWEVAGRYSSIDLNDAGFNGELDDMTAALNWYPHSHIRVMMNYVNGDVNSGGEADVGQLRFQFDF